MGRRIDGELLASTWPGVDRTFVRSWRDSSFKRLIHDGTVSKGIREGAPTRRHRGFEGSATVGLRWKDGHECSRYTARSVLSLCLMAFPPVVCIRRGRPLRAQCKARLMPPCFSLLFRLQDMRLERMEPLFGHLAKQRILTTGQGRSDLRPILRL
jgi:hypothetical protein